MYKRQAQPEIPCYQWQTVEDISRGVESLKGKVDGIIFDGPAGLNESTKTLMAICEGVLLPVGPSMLDLSALQQTLRIAAEIQKARKGFPVVRLVPNKLQRRYRLSQELIHEVESADVLGSSGLGYRQAFADAAGQGTVVWRMGSAARTASKEMKRLFEETLNSESTFEENE